MEQRDGPEAALSSATQQPLANALLAGDSGQETTFPLDPEMLQYALELDKVHFGPLGAVSGSRGRRLRSLLVSLPALWPLLLSMYSAATAAYSFDGCHGTVSNGTVSNGAVTPDTAACVACNGGRTFVRVDASHVGPGILFIGAFLSAMVVAEAAWMRVMVEAAVSRARVLLAYGVLVTHGAFNALLLTATATMGTVLLVAVWVLRTNSLAAVDAVALNGGEPCAVAGGGEAVLRPVFRDSNPLSPSRATSARRRAAGPATASCALTPTPHPPPLRRPAAGDRVDGAERGPIWRHRRVAGAAVERPVPRVQAARPRAPPARALDSHVRFTVPSAALEARLGPVAKGRIEEDCRHRCGTPHLWLLTRSVESTSLGFGYAWPETHGKVSQLLASVQAQEPRFRTIAKR